ncbi:MAG: hypothetical protein KAS94_05520 [Desulfobulbaceae bacterium]|nr:hypothetical protein [Desulfobulbaceae bacterium]
MQRKLVTEMELLSFLNAELKKAGFLKGLYFESLVRLRVDDRDGCNWAFANLKGSASPGSCPVGAEKIVSEARGKFNLK